MSNKEDEMEKAKQLYEQCQEAYTKQPNDGVVVYRGKAREPSPFYNQYHVYAELLFREIGGYKNKPAVSRSDFDNNLLQSVHEKKDFDITALRRRTINKKPKKPYDVYFEIYLNKKVSTPLPFKKQLTVSKVTFEWCSKRYFSKIVSRLEKNIEFMCGKKDVFESRGFPGLYVTRRNEKFPKINAAIERNIYAVSARVMARDHFEATNLVIDAFNLLSNSINIAQTFGTLNFQRLGSRKTLKSTLITVGVYIARDRSGYEIFVDDIDWHKLPKREFKKRNEKLLMNLLRAAQDNNAPVGKRINNVIRELAQTISTDNLNLRQLSFWRCMELATMKYGNSRKHSEIVEIFQNFHSDKTWQLMGDLVAGSRHRYVHQGVSTGSEEPNDFYLNWSQQYAEVALLVLLYLYNNRSTWRTEGDIDTFFDYYSKTDRELELAGKLLAGRKKDRKRRDKK